MNEYFLEFIRSGAGFWFCYSETCRAFVLKFHMRYGNEIHELSMNINATLDPMTTKELIDKTIEDMIRKFDIKLSTGKSE